MRGRAESDTSGGRRRRSRQLRHSPELPEHRAGGGGTAPHTSPPASTDILAETIDHTVHHFLTAVGRQGVDGIAQAGLLINQSLVEARDRNRAAEHHARRAYARHQGGGGPLPTMEQLQLHYAALPSPSLSQWATALETLTAAAVPAALQFMRQLHATQPVRFFSSRPGLPDSVAEDASEDARQSLRSARYCLSVLVNLCFSVVMAFRRMESDLQLWSGLCTADSRPREALARFVYGGGRAEQVSDRGLVDQLLRQLRQVHQSLRDCFTPNLPLLLFSADQQLWSIKQGTVCVTGHPCLHAIPRTPVYLTEEDCWLWLVVAVCAHVIGPCQPPSAVEGRTGRGDALRLQMPPPSLRGNQQYEAGASRTGSRDPSTLPNLRRVRSVADSTLVGSEWPSWAGGSVEPPSPNSTVGLGQAAAHSFSRGTSVQEPSLGPASQYHYSSTTRRTPHPLSSTPLPPATPPRTELLTEAWPEGADRGHAAAAVSPVTAALLSLAGDPIKGGRDYAEKHVFTILSALCLFLKLWLRQRALLSHVMEIWGKRGAGFPSAKVTPGMLSQLGKDMEDTMEHGEPEPVSLSAVLQQHSTMDDVCLAIDCVTDLVANAPQLFLHSAANFTELIRILSTAGPVQLFHAVRARQDQSLAEAIGPVERGGGGGGGRRTKVTPLAFAWRSVGRFTDAVTRLFNQSSERVLAAALSSPVVFATLAPPETCTAILTLVCMQVLCDSVLATKSAVGSGGLASGWSSDDMVRTMANAPATGSAANDPSMWPYWTSWGRWIRVAFNVYMTYDADRANVGRGGPPSSPDSREGVVVENEQFPLYCAGFAQSFGAALEDVFALIVAIKSTKASPEDDAAYFTRGPVDVLAGLAARRLMQLLYILHDSAAAAAAAPSPPPVTQEPVNPVALLLCRDALPFSSLREESLNAMLLLLQRYEGALGSSGGSGTMPAHRQYWLLAVGYLRLSSVNACCTSATHLNGGRGRAYPFAAFEGMSDFICAGPRDSVPFLRDRTYETYDEWLRKGRENAKTVKREPGVANSSKRGAGAAPRAKPVESIRTVGPVDPFQLLRMEARDCCDTLRERLVMSSARFLCVALRLALVAERVGQGDDAGSGGSSTANAAPSSPPPTPRSRSALPPPGAANGPTGHPFTVPGDSDPRAVSQATVYVDAFTRFLLMKDRISSNRLVSCLRAFHDELRREERRSVSGMHDQRSNPEAAAPAAAASTAALRTQPSYLITEADTNEANLFEMEVALFTI